MTYLFIYSSLVLFTFICSIMVAITSLNIIGAQDLGIKITFIGAGALATGLSMFHLGKPLKAWRALLNIKKIMVKPQNSFFLFGFWFYIYRPFYF